MVIIKYIVEGLVSCIYSWAGANTEVPFVQSMVGLLFFASCIVCFLVSLFAIDNKTGLKSYKAVIVSAAITAGYVLLFFLICLTVSAFIE